MPFAKACERKRPEARDGCIVASPLVRCSQPHVWQDLVASNGDCVGVLLSVLNTELDSLPADFWSFIFAGGAASQYSIRTSSHETPGNTDSHK